MVATGSMSPVEPTGYSVTVPVAELATYVRPVASRITLMGSLRPVSGPLMLRAGAASPLALNGYSVTELPPMLAA